MSEPRSRGTSLFLGLLVLATSVYWLHWEWDKKDARYAVLHALEQAKPIQAAIEEHVRVNHSLPKDQSSLPGLAWHVEQEVLDVWDQPTLMTYDMAVKQGIITITFPRQHRHLGGATLVLEPHDVSGTLRWQCTGGTVHDALRSPKCRKKPRK